MHHLILVREMDQQSGCCGRIEGGTMLWGSEVCFSPERRDRMERVGEIYRAVRAAFGSEIEITLLDPRNLVSFVPLVLRDAIRFHVPVGTAFRAATSTSLSTAVFDGQLLYAGETPSPAHVVSLIADRLTIHRVGAEQDSGFGIQDSATKS